MKPPFALVVMGVAGAGKSTLGLALASRLGLPFEDADTYHPPANVEKMARAEPLDDVDRAPWLAGLNRLLARHLRSTGAVLACSALKQAYRDQLQAGLSGVVFVYLQGAFDLIYQRLHERAGHFMQASLLRSQFDALEEPENAIVVSAQAAVDQQVAMVLSELARR